MRKGPIKSREALKLALEIGAALGRAHQRGRVHGGLCPFCIVLTANGVVIVDPTTSPLDREAYQSPEEFGGVRADARSDVFAYGAILYEIATGRRAFEGVGWELRENILMRPAPPIEPRSGIHAAMVRVIADCLEKSPEKRRQRVQNAVIELKMCPTIARTAEIMAYRASLPPGSQARVMGSVPVPPKAARAAAPRSNTLTAAPVEVLGSETEEGPAVTGKASAVMEPPPFPPVPQRPSGPIRNEYPGPPGVLPKWMSAEGVMDAQDRVMEYAGKRSRWFWVSIIGLAVLAVGGLGAWLYLRSQSAGPAVQFSVAQPENTSYPGMPAVSPDGRYLTFSAVGQEGKRMLWLRPLDALKATMIPGSEGASAPFWSPDSQYVAFFADRSLKKVGIKEGAQPETICPAEAQPGGGAWNKDGTILFSPSMSDGFYKVPSVGGKPVPVLKLDETRYERGDLWPQFLPDGRHFVFYLQTDLAESSGVHVGNIDTGEYTKLFATQTNAVYSKGYLLYITERSLMAQKFDVSKMETVDAPVILGNEIGGLRSLALAPISVSANGVLVYQGVGNALRQIVWMDRVGRQLAALGEPNDYGPPRVSPAGDQVAVAKADESGKLAHLWVTDTQGKMQQVTSGAVHEGAPSWSPDGLRLVYFARENDAYDLFARPVSGGGKAEPLLRNDARKFPTDWSRDGKYILFYQEGQGTKLDVWGYSVAEKRAAPIVNTVYSESFGALSPNGKWLAFQSDQSGRSEVYVQAFDGLTSGTRKTWQVSNGGGIPHWRADSGELFYETADGRMMAVEFRESGGEPQLSAPQKLFHTRPLPKTWNTYDVSGDGQRFAVNIPLEWTSSAPITVVTNWIEKLKEQ